MAYCLHYSPGSASMVVRWALLRIGVPFDAVLVDFEQGAQRRPEFLALNPLGRVPVLEIDGAPHTESTAILMLLAERHPEAKLAPPPGSPERADWLEWSIILANGGLPSMRDWFYADRDGSADAADEIRAMARRRLEALWSRIDSRLSDGRAFLAGVGPTTVDLMATMLMRWSRNMPHPATDWPALGRYARAMAADPAFIEVQRVEGLDPWPPSN